MIRRRRRVSQRGAPVPTPISPPSGPTQWLAQGPPAKSKLLATIIRTLSGSMSAKEVIRVEKIEMSKHGSKAIGLNLR